MSPNSNEEKEMPAAAMVQSERSDRDLVPPRPRATLYDVNRGQAKYPTCKPQEHSLSAGLDAETMREVDDLVTARIRLRTGQTLFRDGDRFTSLYWIRAGSFKTVSLLRGGYEQVAGYHMSGEIIGADGIGNDSHRCEAVALEDSEVCSLPFERIEALSRRNRCFQRNLHRLLSREITRARAVTTLLGTMHADQRVGAFLLDLSQRYHERGYSSCEFVLRMTRAEIASYLGLTLETVSRSFSRFHHEGLLQVERRLVKLLDWASLKRLVDCCN
jgi:CRP/FNR family transcriptional regulator, anaerobic regulatory protein